MQEVWKPVKEYEGLYEVSNLGRVKSLCKYHHKREQILKNKITKDGYFETTLYKNGKPKHIRTHRIVASEFLENTQNKKEVNHIDGNKLNNKVDNLEWVTSSENQIHAYKLGLQKVSGGAISNRKKVKCLELDVVKESLTEMQRYLIKKRFTKSENINRLSEILSTGNNKYLGLTFELVKGDD